MEILEYTSKDIETLKDLISELQDSLKEIEPDIIASGSKVRDSYTEALLKDVETHRGQIYLAKNAGAIIGFVAAYVQKYDDEDIEYLYISDLAVTKNERSKGIGKLLLEKAEEYARSKDLGYVRIASQISNEGAMRLYRNTGFVDYIVVLQKKL